MEEEEEETSPPLELSEGQDFNLDFLEINGIDLEKLVQDGGGEYILENISEDNVRELRNYVDNSEFKYKISYCNGNLYIKVSTWLHGFIAGQIMRVVKDFCVAADFDYNVISCWGTCDVPLHGGTQNIFQPDSSFGIPGCHSPNFVFEVFWRNHPTGNYLKFFEKIRDYFLHNDDVLIVIGIIILYPGPQPPSDHLSMVCVVYFRNHFFSVPPNHTEPLRLPIDNGLISFGTQTLTQDQRNAILEGVQSISRNPLRLHYDFVGTVCNIHNQNEETYLVRIPAELLLTANGHLIKPIRYAARVQPNPDRPPLSQAAREPGVYLVPYFPNEWLPLGFQNAPIEPPPGQP